MARKISKVTIHMVASLDGFIAGKDGDVSWMQSTDKYEKGKTLTEADITTFLNSIDCYIMGSRTFEKALELGWPYSDVPVYVISTRSLTTDRKNVSFYSGDLEALVNGQLKPKYKHIWMVGGAQLTKQFMQLKLADELVMSIMPVVLGDGILFFDYIGTKQLLHLKDVTPYQDGMVELSYDIIKEKVD